MTIPENDKDKYPAQDRVVPIGFAPMGTFAYEPYKHSSKLPISHKEASFALNADGSWFDSPGKGLGQADRGDAVFPSSTWMPEGQTSKSVSEDTTLTYPGPIEVKDKDNIVAQIGRDFGSEYAQAFEAIREAIKQGVSLTESIEVTVEHSDFAFDANKLKQLMNQFGYR